MVYKQVSQILTIVTAVPKRHITEHGDRQLKSSKDMLNPSCFYWPHQCTLWPQELNDMGPFYTMAPSVQ